MKMLLTLSFVAVSAFLAGLSISAQRVDSRLVVDALDAVAAAPDNHKVLYEDGHIRLLEVVFGTLGRKSG